MGRTIARISSSSERARSAAGRRCSQPGWAQASSPSSAGCVGQGRQLARSRHRPRAGRHAADRRARSLVDRLLQRPARPLRHRLRLPELGYLILAVTDDDVRAARQRIAMQHAEGLDVRWVDATEVPRPDRRTMVAEGHRGGTYRDGTATSIRRATSSPTRSRCVSSVWTCASAPGTCLRFERTADGRRRVTGIETSRRHDQRRSRPAHRRADPPRRRRAGGLRIPVGAVRHTSSSRAPRGIRRRAQPMVFDIGAGLYWRLEEGGLLCGLEQPGEPPGRHARSTGLSRAHARAPGRVRPGHAGPRDPEDLGRDDRLHAGPPADPGPATEPDGARIEGLRSPQRAATG